MAERTIDEMVHPANSNTSFPFSKLPVELRHRVLYFTFETQIIEIDIHKNASHIRIPAAPIALQINHESRSECLRFYNVVHMSSKAWKKSPFYISPALTTLKLKSSVTPSLPPFWLDCDRSIKKFLDCLSTMFQYKLFVTVETIVNFGAVFDIPRLFDMVFPTGMTMVPLKLLKHCRFARIVLVCPRTSVTEGQVTRLQSVEFRGRMEDKVDEIAMSWNRMRVKLPDMVEDYPWLWHLQFSGVIQDGSAGLLISNIGAVK